MSTKMLVWKQGMVIPESGKKIICFSGKIQAGPADGRIVISGFNTRSDLDGNFIHENEFGPYSEDDFDAIHTFGVARYVLDMYEKLNGEPIRWSWEKDDKSEPLRIFIRNNDINARYLKSARCLELDYFGLYQNWTYYCRSTDIIAHETAHAILDAIQPGWEKGNIETRGIAEAFCDLTAMFFITSQYDCCRDVIRETHGDLMQKSILSEFGIGLGLGTDPLNPIRSSINSNRFSMRFIFSYEFSEVLTGCLYDILADITYLRSGKQGRCNAKQLFEAAKEWQNAIFVTYKMCDKDNESLSGFMVKLCEALPNSAEIIERRFQEREIV